MYKQGVSFVEIAAEYDMTETGIRKICKKHGVKIRREYNTVQGRVNIQDPVPVIFANDRRKVTVLTDSSGKKWLDVTEMIFE